MTSSRESAKQWLRPPTWLSLHDTPQISFVMIKRPSVAAITYFALNCNVHLCWIEVWNNENRLLEMCYFVLLGSAKVTSLILCLRHTSWFFLLLAYYFEINESSLSWFNSSNQLSLKLSLLTYPHGSQLFLPNYQVVFHFFFFFSKISHSHNTLWTYSSFCMRLFFCSMH